MIKAIIKVSAVLAVTALLAGCAPARRMPRYYDASNPLKRVAVLPMKNDTVDVDGPNVVRKKMIEALENKSYIVKDVKETDQILRDQMGISLGGQLDLTTPQKLGETLGVDGVLYGTLMDFDETTAGVLNIRKVRAKFKLINTMTGLALWERGLGVRSEMRMSGRTGDAAAIVARGADARDKDVPWVTIGSTTTYEKNVGQAFALGLGTKLLTKAIGIHLEYESSELVRRATENLPWGPGPGGVVTSAKVTPPPFTGPKLKMPEPPSFGYMDYGKKDFSALLVSVSADKSGTDTYHFEIPLAKAGENLRMDMDLSSMAKGSEGMPPALSKMATIHRGDKKMSYTLYPDSQKYMTHTYTEDEHAPYEKPLVEKTRVGREVIDGHPTDKYKVKITYKDGKVEEGFIWNARDLDHMTIKSEVGNNDVKVTTELKNIVLKTPSASLFEIPAGYSEARGFMDLTAGPK
jgi:hypothetical protein